MRLKKYLAEFMIAIAVTLDAGVALCVRYAAVHGFSAQAIAFGYTLLGLDVICLFAIILNLPPDFPEGLLKGDDSSDFRTRSHATKR